MPIKNTTVIQVEKSLHADNTKVEEDDEETGFFFTPSLVKTIQQHMYMINSHHLLAIQYNNI